MTAKEIDLLFKGTGNPNGPTATEPGKIGGAFSVDGINDYINFAAGGSIDAGDFTISHWINSLDLSGKHTIYEQGRGGLGIQTVTAGTKFGVSVDGTGTTIDTATTDLTTNKWYYVAVTYSNATVKLYINGILENTVSRTASYTRDLAQLGASTNPVGEPVSFFAGLIDDTRIYGRALSDEEILDMYGKGASSTVWYKADGDANDSTGTKNGVLQNGATATEAGKIGNAFSFNGTNQFANMGSVIPTTGISAMTISAWVKNAGGTNIQGIAGWWNGSNGIGISSNPSGAGTIYFVAGAGSSYGQVAIPTSDWTYITLVYDGSLTGDSNRLKGYVNGVQQTLSFPSGSIPSSFSTSGDLVIGKTDNFTDRYWKGKIDEVKIYSRALNNTEVQRQYLEGSSDVAWYKADGDAKDATSNNNDGTLTNGAIATDPGKLRRAFTFDGVNDYVDTGKSLLGSASKSSTAAWVKVSDLKGNQVILSEIGNEGTVGQWQLRVTSTGTLQYIRRASAGSVDASPVKVLTTSDQIKVGAWTYINTVFNGGDDMRIYINGKPATGTFSDEDYPGTAAGTTRIGAGDDGTFPFGGLIDEVHLYSRALLLTDVIGFYNASVCGTYGSLTPPVIPGYETSPKAVISVPFDPNGQDTGAKNNKIVGWAKILKLGDAGWIKLSSNADAPVDSSYSLYYDTTTAHLNGWAWNCVPDPIDPSQCDTSASIGWVVFSGNTLVDAASTAYDLGKSLACTQGTSCEDFSFDPLTGASKWYTEVIAPWLETQGGNIYAKGDAATGGGFKVPDSGLKPPVLNGGFNTTYLIHSNGAISAKWVSECRGVSGGTSCGPSDNPQTPPFNTPNKVNVDAKGNAISYKGSAESFNVPSGGTSGNNYRNKLGLINIGALTDTVVDTDTGKNKYGYKVLSIDDNDNRLFNRLYTKVSLNNNVLYRNGDLNIGLQNTDEPLVFSSGTSDYPSGAGTIVVKGNLYIHTPIKYETSGVTSIVRTPSVAWVVIKRADGTGGNIIVDNCINPYFGSAGSVLLSGAFIAEGTIYTGYGGSSSGDKGIGLPIGPSQDSNKLPLPNNCKSVKDGGSFPNDDIPLQVNGMMMAHDFKFQRVYTGNDIGGESIRDDGRLMANTPPGLEDMTKKLPVWKSERYIP